MKLKKRQYRELIDRLNVQIFGLEYHCADHPVAQELAYIHKDIQSAMFYLGSAHDQLLALMKEKEGQCDE